ncbi:hypothetical protein GJ496_003402 [Pomphorhynchus laevis]|nr:hypothetical protein GJ496_003402 [Pomphorhynchus laevis]
MDHQQLKNAQQECLLAPKKGILRKVNQFEIGTNQDRRRSFRFDEMNIIATYHPEGKDYGIMKIDEAPTPYNKNYDGRKHAAYVDPKQITER